MNNHHQKRTVRIALSVCAAAALATTLQAQASSNPSATTTRAEASANAQLNDDDREFLVDAALLGHEEVRLSQLAATRASNPQVREFAQKLVDDHQKANKKLMSLASSKGLMLSALENAPGVSARIGSSPSSTTGATTSGSHSMDTSASTTSGTTGAGTAAGSTYAAVDPDMHGEINENLTEGLEDIREREADLAEKTGQDFDEAYVEAMIKGHKKSVELFRDVADNEDADREIAEFARENLATLEQHHRTAQQLEEAVD